MIYKEELALIEQLTFDAVHYRNLKPHSYKNILLELGIYDAQ